jgi:3-oxoadipate enol-lactonase
MSGPAVRTEHVGSGPRIAIDWSGEGPLVVFLHGIGGNRSNWAEQVSAFSRDYTVVAWDARGWGDSDDYEGPLEFADFAADLLQVLERFDAQKAHLVGLSMGSRICLDMWKRHPDRIASLTLAAVSAGMHEEIGIEKRRQFLEERRRPLEEGGTCAEMARKVAPKLVSPEAPPEIRQRAIDSLSSLRKASYLKALESVTWYTDFPPFESIAVPTLVISGTEDYLAPPEVTEAIARRIPGAERALFPACGHLVNIERPAEFNARLAGFLSNVEAAHH